MLHFAKKMPPRKRGWSAHDSDTERSPSSLGGSPPVSSSSSKSPEKKKQQKEQKPVISKPPTKSTKGSPPNNNDAASASAAAPQQQGVRPLRQGSVDYAYPSDVDGDSDGDVKPSSSAAAAGVAKAPVSSASFSSSSSSSSAAAAAAAAAAASSSTTTTTNSTTITTTRTSTSTLSKWTSRLVTGAYKSLLSSGTVLECPPIIPLNDEFLKGFGQRVREESRTPPRSRGGGGGGGTVNDEGGESSSAEDSNSDSDSDSDAERESSTPAAPPPPPVAGPVRVRLSNLSYQTTSSRLSAKLSTYGPVVECTVLMEEARGDSLPRSSGRAVAVFQNSEDAKKAVSALNHREFEGRAMRLTLLDASGRELLPGGGNGNGGGSGDNDGEPGVSTMSRGRAPPKLGRTGRYWDVDISTRCYNCGEVGHISKDCQNELKDVPCPFCALPAGHNPSVGSGQSRNEHYDPFNPRNCANLVVCFNCQMPGHVSSLCTLDRGALGRRTATGQRLVCTACGRDGHNRARCSTEPWHIPGADRTVSSGGGGGGKKGGGAKAPAPAAPNWDLAMVCMDCFETGHYGCRNMRWGKAGAAGAVATAAAAAAAEQAKKLEAKKLVEAAAFRDDDSKAPADAGAAANSSSSSSSSSGWSGKGGLKGSFCSNCGFAGHFGGECTRPLLEQCMRNTELVIEEVESVEKRREEMAKGGNGGQRKSTYINFGEEQGNDKERGGGRERDNNNNEWDRNRSNVRSLSPVPGEVEVVGVRGGGQSSASRHSPTPQYSSHHQQQPPPPYQRQQYQQQPPSQPPHYQHHPPQYNQHQQQHPPQYNQHQNQQQHPPQYYHQHPQGGGGGQQREMHRPPPTHSYPPSHTQQPHNNNKRGYGR